VCTLALCLRQMPSYDWEATAGKKYSLLFAQLVQPAGFPRGRIIHYFAYNVCNGSDVTKHLNTTFGTWMAPTRGPFGTRGLYAHFLFEHDTYLAFNQSAGTQIASSAAATDLATLLAAVGLGNAMLVSLNWMAVSDSILSHAILEADRCKLNCHMRLLGYAVESNSTSTRRFYSLFAGIPRTVPTSSMGGRMNQLYLICATRPSILLAPPSSPCLPPTAD
jgi:hypothetical protein